MTAIQVNYILLLLTVQIQAMLDGLGAEWTKFTETLVEAEVMLKKHKEKFKTSLLAQAEEFKKQVKFTFSHKGTHSQGRFFGTVDVLFIVA